MSPVYWHHLVMVDACEVCGDEPAAVDGLCVACEEARNEAAAERSYERFHGGDEPQTLRERMAVDFARTWGRAALGSKR